MHLVSDFYTFYKPVLFQHPDLLLTGAYLAWYWYPAATSDAPVAAGRGGGLTDVSAVVSSWIQTRATLIGALAAASALVVLALGVLQRRRRILRGRPMTTRDSTQ